VEGSGGEELRKGFGGWPGIGGGRRRDGNMAGASPRLRVTEGELAVGDGEAARWWGCHLSHE
jgi:hypothetical protein